jgi:glycosyltransferase involved in cell wall biosynthesis
LVAHWADRVERFSSDPNETEPFDPSLASTMVGYLCDKIGSIQDTEQERIPYRSTCLPTGAEITPAIRSAVRPLLAEIPELFEDPFANVVQALNRPSSKLQPDPSVALEQPAIALAREKRRTDHQTGVNLVGYPRAEMGMGELLRQSAEALSTTCFRFCIVDFNFGIVASQRDTRYDAFVRPDNPFYVNLFNITADQMRLAWQKLGPQFFHNHYNIGYWTWELSNFPNHWQSAIDLVDEIWAPSRFIRDAIAKKTRKPVVWMPLAVEFPMPAGSIEERRKRFDLPRDKFLFFFSFDFSSFATRKNFPASIQAFQKAFPDGCDEAGLVIKTIRHSHHKREFWDLLRAVGEDRRIFLIDRLLRQDEMRELMASCDSFVSLHRSEGFGFGMAEAMYLGKPVIATNYSGNLDFTKKDNSCLVDYRLVPVKAGEYLFPEGQVWADPNIDEAAKYMRRLVDDRDYGRRLGKAAADFIRQQHSAKAVGARYLKRLEQIHSATALPAWLRKVLPARSIKA